ncbi:MAG: WcaF family extracellular polysaccharide biosynthesis acetyltransferase [Bacteroidia bacterium]|nr:WcaF family extracellular polysaccharide biosynthesis acetyltransferase [Bacteroidia bacterium]
MDRNMTAQQGKTNLLAFNNDWYKPGGSAIKRVLWFLVNAVFLINPIIPFSSLKVGLLRLFGAKIGKGVIIKPGVNIKYPWRLTVGNHVWIGERVWIDNLADVKIGNDVCISQGAMLLTGNHNYKKAAFDLMIGEIILEEGVWIGAQCLVAPGVNCKSHAILSAASVTSTDLEAYTIYRGNPAEEVRKREIEVQN